MLSVEPPAKVAVKRNQASEVKLRVRLQPGYHVNSDKPADEYLIPLRLTWTPGEIQAVETQYPKPKLETYEFSQKPLSVFTGDFDIVTKLKPSLKVETGAQVIVGKLRYQACNEKMCLAPKTVEVKLPLEIQ